MKKNIKSLLFCLGLSFALFSCKSEKKESAEVQVTSPEKIETYVYKVDNLTEEGISDTLWRMMFPMNEGIDQISISQEDSTIVYKIDKTVYSEDDILKEMKIRGAKNIVKVY